MTHSVLGVEQCIYIILELLPDERKEEEKCGISCSSFTWCVCVCGVCVTLCVCVCVCVKVGVGCQNAYLLCHGEHAMLERQL